MVIFWRLNIPVGPPPKTALLYHKMCLLFIHTPTENTCNWIILLFKDKYTMERWSLNGDIYVSLLGKASIGGDRHYLRHTYSNSVDFVVGYVFLFPERCASIMSTEECPWKHKVVRWDLTSSNLPLISIQVVSFPWNFLPNQSYSMLLT